MSYALILPVIHRYSNPGLAANTPYRQSEYSHRWVGSVSQLVQLEPVSPRVVIATANNGIAAVIG